jgi:UDP-glucose 4-epimerase
MSYITGNSDKLWDVLRTVLIGAKGFVGQALVRSPGISNHNYLEFDTRDSSNDFEPVEVSQAIIWCASRTNPLLASSNPHIAELELHEWEKFLVDLQRRSYHGKVIFLSSGGCVYSQGEPPYREIDRSEGINDYGRLKLKMEKILISSSLDFRILRVSNLYGPGQLPGRGQGVIAEWKFQMETEKKISVIGSRQNERDFLHIDDLVSAIESVIVRESGPGIFNVGSSRAVSISNLMDVFRKYSEIDFRVEETPARNFDRSSYYLNIDKFQGTFSWMPLIDVDSGVKKLLTTGNPDE